MPDLAALLEICLCLSLLLRKLFNDYALLKHSCMHADIF